MTQTLAIVTDALRESNLIALGVEPKANQADEGLRRLQSLVASVFGSDVGENLEDWPIGLVGVTEHWPRDWGCWNQNIWRYPRTNTRLLLDALGPQIIYFPTQPDDGSRIMVVPVTMDLVAYPVTLDGNGRLIGNAQTVILNDNVTAKRTYMYTSDLASWQLVESFDLEDTFPFPLEFDDYFITKLAMRLNPRYGRAMQAESAERMKQMTRQIKARYRQSQNMPADPAVLRLSDPGWLGRGGRGGRYGWMG